MAADPRQGFYPGTNQIVTVAHGTNKLGTFHLSAEQGKSLDLGSNRFVAVEVEPQLIGTNRVLGWKVSAIQKWPKPHKS